MHSTAASLVAAPFLTALAPIAHRPVASPAIRARRSHSGQTRTVPRPLEPCHPPWACCRRSSQTRPSGGAAFGRHSRSPRSQKCRRSSWMIVVPPPLIWSASGPRCSEIPREGPDPSANQRSRPVIPAWPLAPPDTSWSMSGEGLEAEMAPAPTPPGLIPVDAKRSPECPSCHQG